MIKKIAKFFITAIIAFLLAVIAWYFLLIRIPKEILIQGSAAPVMSKEEALDLMNYHGVKVTWVEDGEWVFDRDGQTCSLIRKK